jgi:hypothetical protein
MEICGEYFGFHQDEDIYRAHYAHFFPLLRLQAGAAYLPGGMIIHYPLLPARPPANCWTTLLLVLNAWCQPTKVLLMVFVR